MTTATVAPPAPVARPAPVALAERLAVGVALAVAALLLSRQLGAFSAEFDEHVYLATADLLGRGMVAGTDVFVSQPPLFFGLLDGAHGLLGGDPTRLRLVAVAVTLVGALGGWALVRSIAGGRAALVALVLLVLSPGVVESAAVVSADLPAMALGTGALVAARWSARAGGGRTALAWAGAAGALLAAAALVKLLAAVFGVALLTAALLRRPPRDRVAAFAAGGVLVLAATAAAYAGELGALWDGAVGFHLEARDAVRIAAPKPLTIVLGMTAGFVGLFVLAAAGALTVPRAQLRAWCVARADLLGLLVGGLLLCALQRPLLQHHLVVVAWPLALLAASSLPRRPGPRALVAAGAGVALLLPWAGHGRDTFDDAELGRVRAAAEVVRAGTTPADRVVSDLPIVPLMAGRAVAPETADPSYVRVGTGSLDRTAILRAGDRSGAVVVGRAFEQVPGLEPALRRRFGAPTVVGGVRVYLRVPAS